MNHLTTQMENTPHFITHVMETLHKAVVQENFFENELSSLENANAVLFLLGKRKHQKTDRPETCLILTKRSLTVKQPGDLCCPGGGLSFKLDSIIAKLMTLPGFPLFRWPYLSKMRKSEPAGFKKMNLLLATGLREGFEEMRLNPFLVKFLGVLPPQQLIMFRRKIYPMACWNTNQRRFSTNSEVEKMIYIPVNELLRPENYACYRVKLNSVQGSRQKSETHNYLCYIHKDGNEKEKLWGATFRITMNFLDVIFGFKPPNLNSLPVIEGILNNEYLSGNRL